MSGFELRLQGGEPREFQRRQRQVTKNETRAGLRKVANFGQKSKGGIASGGAPAVSFYKLFVPRETVKGDAVEVRGLGFGV